MPISKHFSPIRLNDMNWDAGSILYEFSALREPERTQFPKIGKYLRGLGMEFNEVRPQMLWRGQFHPDLYIANQLDAVPDEIIDKTTIIYVPTPISENKSGWPDNYDFNQCSRIMHGEQFHAMFIEPMAQKILGVPTTEMCAKYHRSAWLPRYWLQTLREKKSLETKFWYPRLGYAGSVAERLSDNETTRPKPISGVSDFDTVELTITFILAKPTRPFQCLFVVDKSPIYRVTEMDACAGIEANYHRFVVESREYCQDIGDEAQRLNLLQAVRYSSQKKIRMPIPSLANVRRGWKPAPHMNAQILRIMESNDTATQP